MILLLAGDQQAQKLNRILGYSQTSKIHIGYLHWIFNMVVNVHNIKQMAKCLGTFRIST